MLLSLLIVLVTVSALTPFARVCEGQESGQSCRPLGYQDPTVFLTVGLVLLIAFPDIKWVKASSEGLEASRDPKLLSDNADLSNRVAELERDKMQQWDQGTQNDPHQPEEDTGDGKSP